jgi:inorganic pyrophosphatase
MNRAVGENEVIVLIEIPRGSRNKYEYDSELDAIVLDRRLFTSTVYPADYGFVEGTLGEDGDPLDALVLVGDPTFPGCRIRVRTVAVFRMVDEKGPDDKLVCVPLRDPMWSEVVEVDDIPIAFRAEIEQFFKVYKDLEGLPTQTAGFGDRGEAFGVLAEARARSAAAETGR